MKDMALLVAAIVFILVAIMHLLRLIFKVEIKIGTKVLPMSLSIIGFLVAAALGYWMLSARL
jgi:hypothetical protein